MRDSETFDAFYARTAWNVTSQMHSMTGQDSEADHAVREAYARAYQQWYEVSGHHDPEAWVLTVAQEAYQRRQAQSAAAGVEPVRPDPHTWPGIYRPVAAASPGRADPEVASPPPVSLPTGGAVMGGAVVDGAVVGGAATIGAATGGPATIGPATAGPVATGMPDPAVAGRQDQPGHARTGLARTGLFRTGLGRAEAGRAGPSRTGPSRPGLLRTAIPRAGSLRNRRTLIVAMAAIVVVATGAYLAFGGQPATSANSARGKSPTTGAAVHMLAAGRTGSRATVPWSIVGQGWTLAEFSAAQPAASGTPSGRGRLSLYLVDPDGGKYQLRTWAGGSLTLLAWSGDATHALLSGTAGNAGTQRASYSVLTLASGQLTPLRLPANVVPVGFTRPHGTNILAIRRTARKFELRRYDLGGRYQATLSTIPDQQTLPNWQLSDCASVCNALSSPDGDLAVWGVAGKEMQLVNNAGGLIRRLHVPSSGNPPSCLPLSWWRATTVLADCAAPGQPSPGSQRLWLVPVSGSSPTPLTQPSGMSSGVGFDTAAWTAGGQVYLTQTSTAQCPTAPTGPGGLGIGRVAQDGSPTAVKVPDSTGNYDNVVAGVGGRLLVLAQTSCPGTSSLLWFSPSSGTAQTLLTAPATELGVVAAVPYRAAPTAFTAG